jgi:hypothetical protein
VARGQVEGDLVEDSSLPGFSILKGILGTNIAFKNHGSPRKNPGTEYKMPRARAQQIAEGPAGVTGSISAGAVQIAEAAPAYSVETGTNGVIVPFIADMYVDASGTVGTLQQVSVVMTGIDEVFDVTVSEADAVKILNAFVITDISAGYAESAAAQVNVAMKSRADFLDGLAAALAGNPTGENSAETLYAWLKRESRKDTVDLLSYDSLVNLLEASDLLTYDVSIDASGASGNMWDAMDGGAAAYRKAIFTQISKANIDAYVTPSDGSEQNSDPASGLGFLPLLKGDKLSFVFDVAVGEYAWDNVAPLSGAKINSVVNDAATANADGSFGGAGTVQQGGSSSTSNVAIGPGYAQNNAQLVFTTPSTRRVAIVVQMTSGSGAFTKSEAGVPSEATLLTA